MLNSFFEGFEKQAGIVEKSLGMIGKAGKSMSNAGLNMATNPTGGEISGAIGKGMHATGNFIRKNRALVGAGAVGAGAGMVAGRSSKD